jgi:putative transposase
VIRPLAAMSRLDARSAEAATLRLALSERRVYALLHAFRDNPVTASLLPRKPGPKAGSRRLDSAIEAQIEAAITTVYLTRERPTLSRVLRQITRDCRAAGLSRLR